MDKVLRRKTPAAHKRQTSCNSEINIKKRQSRQKKQDCRQIFSYMIWSCSNAQAIPSSSTSLVMKVA